MTPIIIKITGHKPEPAGSKKAFTIRRKGTAGNKRSDFRSVVVDANDKSRSWKDEVSMYATGELCLSQIREPLKCPLHLTLNFTLERPKSHWRTGKNSHLLRYNSPEYPTSKPDVLKLARAVEDALTFIVYADDAQIVQETLSKRYGESAGVEIIVQEYKGENV